MTATENGLGDDFSAVRAHAHLELHMQQCAEWRAETRASFIALHARLDAMQKSFDQRLWGAAKTAIVLLLGGGGTLLFFLLTKGGHL